MWIWLMRHRMRICVEEGGALQSRPEGSSFGGIFPQLLPACSFGRVCSHSFNVWMAMAYASIISPAITENNFSSSSPSFYSPSPSSPPSSPPPSQPAPKLNEFLLPINSLVRSIFSSATSHRFSTRPFSSIRTAMASSL